MTSLSLPIGGAYVPAMADESIIVKDKGTIFLAGPPLVRAATGEVVTEQELGGADLHCRESGVTDYFAVDDRHALSLVRRVVSRLNRKKPANLEVKTPEDPLFSPQEMCQLASPNVQRPFLMYEILARIVDGSR